MVTAAEYWGGVIFVFFSCLISLMTFVIAKKLYVNAAPNEKVGLYKYILMLNVECIPFGSSLLVFEGERLKIFRTYALIMRTVMSFGVVVGLAGFGYEIFLD